MEKVMQNLLFTAKAVRCHLDVALSHEGGSLPVWLVLNTLSGSEGVTQTHLADSINIETPTLTRHLDRLERYGLIERRRDAEDRRVTRIYMSPAGRCLHHELYAVVQRFESNLSRGLTAKQIAELNQLLNQIKGNVKHTSFSC